MLNYKFATIWLVLVQLHLRQMAKFLELKNESFYSFKINASFPIVNFNLLLDCNNLIFGLARSSQKKSHIKTVLFT